MMKVCVLVLVCLVLLIAPSVKAQSNDAELNGNYAFTFDGITGANGISNGYAAVGRLTADGAGNITNGEVDTNAAGGGLTAQAFTGTYSIGADHRGVMTLNVTGATKRFAIAMLADGSAKFIEMDATGGAGTIGSGRIEKSTPTAFSTAQIAGEYAFGIAGQDNTNNRAAIVGRFTSGGNGTFTNVAGDVNAYGTVSPLTFNSATYAVSNAATGRGTMHFSFTFSGGAVSLDFAFYVVNSGKLFAMVTDPVTTATPLLNGTMLRQNVPTGGFTDASLNSNMALYMTGLSACGTVNGIPKAVAGVLTGDGAGTFSLSFDENFCSVPRTVTATPGTYTVANNGRTTMSLNGDGLIQYLTGANEGFMISIDPAVLSGFGEPQAGGALTNGSVTGGYAGVATDPTAFTVNVFSGEFSANGASPTGSLSGHVDIGDASGSQSGVSFAATYSVTSSPTNGRGTVNLTSPSGGSAVAYVISPTKFVVIPMSDPNPAVWEFDQAPSASAAVTLSALALNPTTVTGGTQSSTGTVTLSGAAPAGGAVVALSSNNTAAARVPASVTVAAGATTASFTVSTSAVSAATAVTISAAFGGTTRTATLTVNPATPPPVTLSSLTLNPTSVTGGTQSSTGTVTLSGAAPSGGAVVALSSNNTAAARVPASVTVAAGATTASFTVSTSAVTSNTTVTISAAYGGATRTAALTVRLQSPPQITLSSVSLSPTSVTGGTQSSTGTVTLSGAAPSGGAVVSLSSNNTAAARVPASVTVAAGATTASFTVGTSAVSAATTVTISAAFGGTTRTATLMVNPAAPPPVTLSSLTLNPTSVTGGTQSSTGTVTLSGAAPTGGAVVSLSSNNTGAARVPGSVTVAAGATTASFTVSTSAVITSTTVTITAAYGGTTRTATLTVKPALLPTVAALMLNPSSVVGGLQSSVGTVKLSAPAPAGGASVALARSNFAASIPSSVFVPAGATSASFWVNTSIVLISTSTNITASYNNSSRTATLSVLL